MEDREIMESLLQTAKGACDLYMHGTIESSTQNVHSAMDGALNETLQMQDTVYKQMAQKGWYPTQQAQPQQLQQVKQKYSSML